VRHYSAQVVILQTKLTHGKTWCWEGSLGCSISVETVHFRQCVSRVLHNLHLGAPDSVGAVADSGGFRAGFGTVRMVIFERVLVCQQSWGALGLSIRVLKGGVFKAGQVQIQLQGQVLVGFVELAADHWLALFNFTLQLLAIHHPLRGQHSVHLCEKRSCICRSLSNSIKTVEHTCGVLFCILIDFERLFIDLSLWLTVLHFERPDSHLSFQGVDNVFDLGI